MICHCKSVLVSPSHFLVLSVSGNGFQEHSFFSTARSDVRLIGLLFAESFIFPVLKITVRYALF